MDAGVDHFGRLLKRAFELPLSGMSISLMFSLSHAHIEGAAQLRRWGKAEDTIGKLREVAEFASVNHIPNAIDTIADRLHLWWREKHANIYSRQVRRRRRATPLRAPARRGSMSASTAGGLSSASLLRRVSRNCCHCRATPMCCASRACTRLGGSLRCGPL